jgi:hypothetical protein
MGGGGALEGALEGSTADLRWLDAQRLRAVPGVKDRKDSLEYLGLIRKTYIVLTVSNHFHSVV